MNCEPQRWYLGNTESARAARVAAYKTSALPLVLLFQLLLLSIKSNTVNIFSYVNPLASAATTQICDCNVKAVIDKKSMKGPER